MSSSAGYKSASTGLVPLPAPSCSTSSCSPTSSGPTVGEFLGLPGEPGLRRAADRLRGRSRAPGGAGRHAPGRRALSCSSIDPPFICWDRAPYSDIGQSCGSTDGRDLQFAPGMRCRRQPACRRGGRPVRSLVLRGELDQSTVPDLERNIARVMAPRRALVLNLAHSPSWQAPGSAASSMRGWAAANGSSFRMPPTRFAAFFD